MFTMSINKEPATPPPMIGKIGPYTVFVTPPPTPKPSSESPKNNKVSTPIQHSVQPPPLVKSTPPVQPPPVQPPPVQYQKSAAVQSSSNGSFGFFWNAVAKVQNAHSSLDDYVAHWFGLNQSKYQWALDDYYESKGMDQLDAKSKDISTKEQSV